MADRSVDDLVRIGQARLDRITETMLVCNLRWSEARRKERTNRGSPFPNLSLRRHR